MKQEEEKEQKRAFLDEKEATKKALEILLRLNALVKTAKIYQPNNFIFLNQIDQLYAVIQDILKTTGEVSFTLRQNALFFLDMRVRFGFSDYNLFRFVSTEFQRREMSHVNFKAGISKEELKRFILLLPSKEEKTDRPFEDFLRKVAENNIQHVIIEKIRFSEIAKSSQRNAAKVFFMGVKHLKDMFESLKKEETISLSTTRRLIQSMFNHLVDNESFIHGLTNIKNYHEYTLNHSVNVCLLSLALGRRLGLEKNELVDLGISAFLHDFGKTEIPQEILDKPAKLDERERSIIEKHPHLGAEKLVQLKKYSYMPVEAVNVAMEHHVKEDLSGYPQYKMKKSVNLYSKIVKICDFFDALTTRRPYREKVFTRDETLKMMMEKSGEEFDPILMKVFINMMGIFPVGTVVLLHTGEIGIVFELNTEAAFMDRPKVKLITDHKGNKIDGEIVNLTETDEQTNQYKRTILKSLDAEKYNIQVSEHILAEVQ
ncbi:MAG: HD-GYP domain-containing protein [Candidatus Aminicenantes bacterium]